MRTTVDLPDETFRALKALAVQRGISLKEILRRAAEKEIAQDDFASKLRVSLPVVRSKQPGSLDLTNADIEDLLT